MNIYYVYAYLRLDGTPYYIGKGKKRRAFVQHQYVNCNDRSRIRFISENLDEDAALELEVRLIQYFGRKDKGTGILRNMTDGGEGQSGWIMPESERQRISKLHRGRKQTPESIAKRIAACTGKKRSDEAKRRMSEAAKRRYSKPLEHPLQ